MKKELLLLVSFLLGLNFASVTIGQNITTDLKSTPKSDVFMQGFYWNSTPGGIWYDTVITIAPRLASAGFSGIWLPSPVKGAGGGLSMGYDPYDHYDFGEYNQKGSRETRFGSRTELENAIAALHNVGVQVYADAVLRHMMGGEVSAPYQCIPSYNGHNIVADSAYLVFDYPSGSGRFKKSPATFYPNSLNCWVDPLFVAIDPIFRFGEWFDHNKQEVRDSLIAWGSYLKGTLKFDGFRLDAVKAIDPVFMAKWLKGCNTGGYAVAEYWGSTSEIGNWLNIAKNQQGASVAMFDFPLRYVLKDMCNNTSGSFDMNNLDGAGLVNSGFSGYDVSTFVENHDFDRIGYDGQIDTGHDPIITDKQLAYAYTLFSEGRPCVFFKDYFQYGYSGKIDTLIWIRQHFLGGGTTKRSSLNAYYIRQDNNTNQSELSKDVYIAKRNGYETLPGGYLLINDNPSNWIDVWVDTDKPVGSWYKDYTGKDVNKQVVGPATAGGPNRVKLWVPARSYTLYVPDTTQVINHPPALVPIADQIAYTNSFFSVKVNAFDVNNKPLTFSISNNPSWMTISATGVISGTPAFADTGSKSVIVTVKDPSNSVAIDTFIVNVKLNRAPVLSPVSNGSVKATYRYEQTVHAVDADNDSLHYGLTSAPNWLNMGELTGQITGTPGVADTGLYSIKLSVTDNKGAYDSTTFSLRVRQNIDSIIATYGRPKIDGVINLSDEDWRLTWKVATDSDTDSYWKKVDTLENECLGMFVTWDADSLYIGSQYVINDRYNTFMLYIDAGLPGGVTNFNSNQGYHGDYAKNFRFRPNDAIDFFMADYYHSDPSFFKITAANGSEDISTKIHGKRGLLGHDNEMAIAWNDIYGLGPGLVPPGVQLKIVSLVAGGLNYGAGDSCPDNPDTRGTAGPDSLINFIVVKPDTNSNGIPDPTLYISDARDGGKTITTIRNYGLSQNFPNPFNPSTIISYELPERSFVDIRVFDILGREIKSLVHDEKNAGVYNVTLDMSNLPSGIYFYRMITPKFMQTKKLNLLK